MPHALGLALITGVGTEGSAVMAHAPPALDTMSGEGGGHFLADGLDADKGTAEGAGMQDAPFTILPPPRQGHEANGGGHAEAQAHAETAEQRVGHDTSSRRARRRPYAPCPVAERDRRTVGLPRHDPGESRR